MAMGLGILTGLAIEALAEEPKRAVGYVSWTGEVFMRLLRMVIVPLVMTSIISGVGGLGSGRRFASMFSKTVAYYMVTSLVAITIGLILVNLIGPGVDAPLVDREPLEAPPRPATLWEVVLRMIPENPVAAMAEMDMLAIIFFSIVFGLALSFAKGPQADNLLELFQSLFGIMRLITGAVIRLAPIGVFGLIAKQVVGAGFEQFAAMAMYAITIASALAIHGLVVLPAILWFVARKNPLEHVRNVGAALATAFSTASSAATLPVTMSCLERNSRVSTRVSSFVLPLGATVNMDGTALYECIGAIFIAQVLGIELTLTQQMVVVLTALLASIGAAGIPAAGLVMIFIVLEAIDLLQYPGVYVVVAMMLAIDRPLDMGRTMVNVFSDTVVTLIVAKSEPDGMLPPAAADE